MPLDGTLTVTVTDGAVEFAFTVQNGGTEPVGLEFPSGKVADVAVYEAGIEVWRWSDGRAFAQGVVTETLEPGEAFTHGATWSDPEPGEYTAEASLAATNLTLVERAPFAVERA